MHILLIEDDSAIAGFVADGLREAGHQADAATDGADGLAKAAQGAYDAIVLDLMLPDMDGASVLQALRAQGLATPVIVLSARQSTEDKVLCLNGGCDDYMTKPFVMAELLARLKALTRRRAGGEQKTRLEREGLTLDLLQRKAYRDGQPIELKSREFALLAYLMENAGSVVTRATIMRHVWGYDFTPGTNIIDVYVCQLREKIECGGQKQRLIHTIRGSGYVFKSPDDMG